MSDDALPEHRYLLTVEAIVGRDKYDNDEKRERLAVVMTQEQWDRVYVALLETLVK